MVFKQEELPHPPLPITHKTKQETWIILLSLSNNIVYTVQTLTFRCLYNYMVSVSAILDADTIIHSLFF